uniref:Ribosomal protein L14 n=1 Tax=Antonospora locustae TaxID=278021 RepID=B6UKY2_ANTLO|nr:ribosomal protein L14 [Antonospora locustae]6ZU5_LM0 Chain LM0, eL14 [Paranosema locustae]
MAKNFVQVGRLATPRFLAQRNILYVITDIQDDSMVIVQDAQGTRKLVSVKSLHLMDDVVEIHRDMSVEEVSKKIPQQKEEEVSENDFERFKRELRTEIEEEVLRSRGF